MAFTHGFTRAVAVTGLTFVLKDRTTGDPITSGTVTGYITKDGGSQSALTNSPAHEGNGQWSVDLTAGEMTADIVGLVFIHTSADPKEITIKTDPPAAAATTATVDDIAAAANTPKRVRTEEGTVEERAVEELIEADRYTKAGDADKPPWGMKVARSKPGGTVDRPSESS